MSNFPKAYEGVYEPEVLYDFDPRNLPPEMLQAVGLVVASAAQTESVVQDFICGLLGIDMFVGRALTNQMSARLKDQVSRAIAELNGPSVSEVDRIDDLLDAINAAYAKRNAIVHGALCQHPATGEVLSYREQSRGSYRMSLQPVTAAAFENDALLIYEAGMNLMRFMTSRGIVPRNRTRDLHAPIDRRQKARAERREALARDSQ